MPSQSITTGKNTQIGDAIFDGVFENSLDFRIEMDYDVGRQFIRRIDQYNAFFSANVLAALDAIDELIPRMRFGEGNPNNGRRDFKISLGREGSPVLYIERIEWGDTERLSDDRIRLICREMQSVAAADEADSSIEPLPLSGGRKVTFRFWWD